MWPWRHNPIDQSEFSCHAGFSGMPPRPARHKLFNAITLKKRADIAGSFGMSLSPSCDCSWRNEWQIIPNYHERMNDKPPSKLPECLWVPMTTTSQCKCCPTVRNASCCASLKKVQWVLELKLLHVAQKTNKVYDCCLLILCWFHDYKVLATINFFRVSHQLCCSGIQLQYVIRSHNLIFDNLYKPTVMIR